MKTVDPRIEAVAEVLEQRNENDDWEWCLGDAIAALAAADAVDPLRLPGHVLEVRPTSYGIQHPPACRPNLLACELETFMANLEKAPALPGRYPAELVDEELVLGSKLDPQQHQALADPKGIALVQAIRDRKNGPSEKVGLSSAMAERGRRGGESSDRVVGTGDGGRGRPDSE